MKNNFMGGRTLSQDYPVSRDWEDIDCKAQSCVYNIYLKCSVSSLAKIGEDGKCLGYKIEIEKSSKNNKNEEIK